METRKLIICRGIQGSGKSTFAKQWCHEDPEHRIRFNNDDIRNMLGDYWVPNREKLVTQAKANMITFALISGYDVVIDNMNLNPKEDQWIRTLCTNIEKDRNIHINIEYKDFWTPVEECIRRDAMRPNPIGEKTIRETWKRYRNFIIKEEITKMQENKLQQDTTKPYAVVFDMDATLCLNTSGRPFYGEGSVEGMKLDEPVEELLELAYMIQLQNFYDVIIVTGREDSTECREATFSWLEEHGITPTSIYMREKGDYSSGEKCKKKLIEKVLQKYCVRLVVEDNNKCVKMYRDMGLVCLQPNEGKF